MKTNRTPKKRTNMEGFGMILQINMALKKSACGWGIIHSGENRPKV
jgi:hypothetical protein